MKIGVLTLFQRRHANGKPVLAELLDRLEAAEKERDNANAAAVNIALEAERLQCENDALRVKVETAENDAAHQKALADSALRVAEGWERMCGELRAALRHEADCVEAAKAKIEALRAKIAEMEKQEPLITVLREPDYWSGEHFHKGTRPYISLRQMSRLKIGQKLYALPGAKGE